MDPILADVEWEALAGIFTGFGLCVVLPLIWILLAHQRKMAEILHGSQARNTASDERIAHLEAELRELRTRLDDSIIRADDRERRIEDRLQRQDVNG